MNEKNQAGHGVEVDLCPFCGAYPYFPDAKDVYGTCYDAGCEVCGIATISIQIIDCFDHPREHVHDSWDENTHQYGLKYIEVVRQNAIGQWNARAINTRAIIRNVGLLEDL